MDMIVVVVMVVLMWFRSWADIVEILDTECEIDNAEVCC